MQYAGQMINGCPFITEFFDPSKVLIEGCRTGRVGDQMSLDGESYEFQVLLGPLPLCRYGSEPPSVEDDVNVRRYAVLSFVIPY